MRVAQEAAGGPPAMPYAELWDMALSCCWNLSTAHPVSYIRDMTFMITADSIGGMSLAV